MISPLTRFYFGEYRGHIEEALHEIRDNKIVRRILDRDHTVWSADPSEISNRLGWIQSPRKMKDSARELMSFSNQVRSEGYRRVILCGMGGSSLAPEVMNKSFGTRRGYPEFTVLDSTDPSAVLHAKGDFNLNETLFIVATKSGTTVETLSCFKYFYGEAVRLLGRERAGRSFVAITDPESPLAESAKTLGFRKIYLNDPDIGGRYSALSYFGLVPAAFMGLDISKLLESGISQLSRYENGDDEEHTREVGTILGAAMGSLAALGRDKLTIIASSKIESLSSWIEQLIAESTGKEGRGILPVVGESPGSSDFYGSDRFVIYLRMFGDDSRNGEFLRLVDSGYPAMSIELKDTFDLGEQFFLWEMATAIAGCLLKINPFDQPDVESAKIRAQAMMEAYRKSGNLPEGGFEQVSKGISVYGHSGAMSLEGVLSEFMKRVEKGCYISIHAYMEATPERDSMLSEFRSRLLELYNRTTTVGYGPRFLHSTGQLHKGDGGKGSFLQITVDDGTDLPIPDAPGESSSSISFGVLKAAQAFGDMRALVERGRRVLRIHLGSNIEEGLESLIKAVS